ncbi:hypothetical protein GCM10027589_11990 [Actinocorallia lasiicapitis]
MVTPLLSADPRRLGAYWLAGRLGAGGQGVVYEGYDPAGGRVAVKALHADQITDAYRSELRREVAALSRVASFCTARIIEADLDHVPPFLVSEYVPGPDLQGWVDRKGAYAPDELVRLGIGIATALTSIHQAGVVHRDLKPANVLLGPDGPRVIDFGIARTEEMSRSATGSLKGTPRWMAPEVFKGQRATSAVDIWAWGAIMVFAASGKAPFDGESLPSLIHQVLNTEVDLDAVPASLLPLVERAMSHDPEARPTARGLLDALIGDAPLEAGKRAASALPAVTITPSLAQLAEQAYNSLDPEAKAAVPGILLRMVGVTPEAFRSVTYAELLVVELPEDSVRRALTAFTDAGLISHAADGIRLAVPALLRAWPRLQDWAAEEGSVLDAHNALADAARRWDSHGRKPADLLHGTTLDDTITGTLTGRRHLTLNRLERAYLDGSVQAARRRGRNRTLLAAALSVLLAVATCTAVTALVQGRSLAEKNQTVTRQRDDVIGAQVANIATTMRRVDPVTARRLAVVAQNLAPGAFDARNALATLYHQWEEDLFTPPGVSGDWRRAFDGQGRIAAYGDDRTVKIVDVDARRVVREIGLGVPVRDNKYPLSLSADGKRLSVMLAGGLTEIYDVTTGERLPGSFLLREPYGELVHDGKWFVSVEAGRTTVRDAETGAEIFTLPYHFTVTAFAPKSGLLVGTKGASLEIWDVVAKKRRTAPKLKIGKEPISGLAISPDGNQVAITQGQPGERGYQVKIIDWPRQWVTVRTVPRPIGHGSPAFSSDSRYLLLSGTIWDTRSARDYPIFRYQGADACDGQTFGPDDRTLRCFDPQGRITVLSLRTFRDIPNLYPPLETPSFSLLSGDGSTMIAAEAQKLAVWDPVKRERRGELPIASSSDPENHALAHDGSALAHWSDDGRIELWDVPSATLKSTLATGKKMDETTPVRFSPDRKTLAVLTAPGKESVLDLWDVPSGTLRASVPGVPDGTASEPDGDELSEHPKILFTADGRTVISAPDQGLVEVATGKRLIEPVRPLESGQAISADGLIASLVKGGGAGSGTGYGLSEIMAFWRAGDLGHESDARVGAPPGPSMAFSPDGKALAVSDYSGRIRLWDVAARRSLGLPLTGIAYDTRYPKTASSLAFAPDGGTVLSIDSDGLLRTHLLDPARIATELCARYGALSPEDWATFIPIIPYRKTC